MTNCAKMLVLAQCFKFIFHFFMLHLKIWILSLKPLVFTLNLILVFKCTLASTSSLKEVLFTHWEPSNGHSCTAVQSSTPGARATDSQQSPERPDSGVVHNPNSKALCATSTWFAFIHSTVVSYWKNLTNSKLAITPLFSLQWRARNFSQKRFNLRKKSFWQDSSHKVPLDLALVSNCSLQ